jgi:hypothetical protein
MPPLTPMIPAIEIGAKGVLPGERSSENHPQPGDRCVSRPYTHGTLPSLPRLILCVLVYSPPVILQMVGPADPAGPSTPSPVPLYILLGGTVPSHVSVHPLLVFEREMRRGHHIPSQPPTRHPSPSLETPPQSALASLHHCLR